MKKSLISIYMLVVFLWLTISAPQALKISSVVTGFSRWNRMLLPNTVPPRMVHWCFIDTYAQLSHRLTTQRAVSRTDVENLDARCDLFNLFWIYDWSLLQKHPKVNALPAGRLLSLKPSKSRCLIVLYYFDYALSSFFPLRHVDQHVNMLINMLINTWAAAFIKVVAHVNISWHIHRR